MWLILILVNLIKYYRILFKIRNKPICISRKQSITAMQNKYLETSKRCSPKKKLMIISIKDSVDKWDFLTNSVTTSSSLISNWNYSAIIVLPTFSMCHQGERLLLWTRTSSCNKLHSGQSRSSSIQIDFPRNVKSSSY